MDRILNLQFSMFGNFESIKPDSDITMKLLENFQRDTFIPGTVDVAIIDAESKKFETKSRLQLFSKDKSWGIVFLQERIDLNYYHTDDSKIYSEIEDVFAYARELIDRVCKVFPKEQGNRLAVNGKFLLLKMSVEDRRRFIYRFSNPLNIDNTSEISEWKIKTNTPSFVELEDQRNEKCNKLIKMGDCLFTENDKQERRMLISLDINTIFEDNEFRFVLKDLKSFSKNAEEWMNKALEEIERG